MTLLRVLASAQVTISHTFYVDETPTDASGDVAVSVKRLDGTVIAAATAAHPGAPGVYSYPLPPQPAPDTVVVEWKGTIAGAPVTARDTIEMVGGFLFGLAEARSLPPALDPVRFPTSAIASERIAVEQECERICGQAFVPRFARVSLNGTNKETIVLPHYNVRRLRSVTVDGTALAAEELADCWIDAGMVLVRGRYRQGWWPPGIGNVVVEYEHGMDDPPEEIRRAAMLRLRSRLTTSDNGIPTRAVSFTPTEGGFYRLATPGGNRTGLPEVDAAYDRYTVDVWGFA